MFSLFPQYWGNPAEFEGSIIMEEMHRVNRASMQEAASFSCTEGVTLDSDSVLAIPFFFYMQLAFFYRYSITLKSG